MFEETHSDLVPKTAYGVLCNLTKKKRKKDRQEEEKPRRPPSMENRLNAKGDSREWKESLKSLKQ